MVTGLREAFPDRREFRHAEGNSTAHLKCSYVGPSQTVLIEDCLLYTSGRRFCGLPAPEWRNNMTNKEIFIETYNKNIHRPGAEKLLAWLEGTDFFTAPASTRFHAAYELSLIHI